MIIYAYRCLKCGHEWIAGIIQNNQGDNPQTVERPKRCPKCRTVRWDTVWAVQPVKAS